MIRELIIRFNKEGEYFREIDEERHYFLSEAEQIVQTIRKRIEKEKRVVSPKGFECWIEGKKLIVTHVSFDKKDRLEKQLTDTILSFNEWTEEIRHKYINLLTDYAEEERQLFVNKEFEAFAIRFDQLLAGEEVKPFPLVLSIGQLKQLYDEMTIHIKSSFYSELEEVVTNIKISYQIHVEKIERALFEDGTLQQSNQFKSSIDQLFRDEEAFKGFVLYVGASYQSVPKKRIHALCARFRPYQDFQLYLFEHIVQTFDFFEVVQFQNKLLEALDDKYDEIMIRGFALSTDEMIESLVINPVIIVEENALMILVKKRELENKELKEEGVSMTEGVEENEAQPKEVDFSKR